MAHTRRASPQLPRAAPAGAQRPRAASSGHRPEAAGARGGRGGGAAGPAPGYRRCGRAEQGSKRRVGAGRPGTELDPRPAHPANEDAALFAPDLGVWAAPGPRPGAFPPPRTAPGVPPAAREQPGGWGRGGGGAGPGRPVPGRPRRVPPRPAPPVPLKAPRPRPSGPAPRAARPSGDCLRNAGLGVAMRQRGARDLAVGQCAPGAAVGPAARLPARMCVHACACARFLGSPSAHQQDGVRL